MIFCITGTGTDIGKTFVTAKLLETLNTAGIAASSFKLVQTGADRYPAPDISTHRSGSPTEDDIAGRSCGALYRLAASPHLAAEVEGKTVDSAAIWQKLQEYQTRYAGSLILCEGAGGIYSPLSRQELTSEFIKRHKLPHLLTAHAGLGSIHSTIAAVKALAAEDLLPAALLFNPYPPEPAAISLDNARFIKEWLAANFPALPFMAIDDRQALLQFFMRLKR